MDDNRAFRRRILLMAIVSDMAIAPGKCKSKRKIKSPTQANDGLEWATRPDTPAHRTNGVVCHANAG